VKKINYNNKISTSLILSLIIHFLFSLYFFKNQLIPNSNQLKKVVIQDKKRTINLKEIKFISKNKLEEIKKQIVTSDQNGKKEKPIDSKFSGMIDQRFDRQVVAKNIDKFNEAGIGGKLASNLNHSENSTQNKKIKKKELSNPKLSLSNLGTLSINSNLNKQTDTEIDEQLELAKAQNILGVENGKRSNKGLASNNDYVEDVPLGDVTNLNTTENKYYSFYFRIKQKLEQHWGSSIHERAKSLYKSGRRFPASENLITAISVTLNENGNILDIKIEGTSGIRELDQAAIESFNKAGPFPNPPKGLVVDGRAVIQWGFVVKS
jgi:protein TonB